VNPAATAVELYVYFHAPPAAAPAVQSAFERLRTDLAEHDPDLEVRLLRRPEVSDGAQTWMEVYRRPGGLAAELERRIASVAERAFDGLPIGPRHVERFIACAW
jgi:Domain of unknown function (DUF4936)